MASKTYQVKAGDTLSAIAKNSGVKIGDISGYKSGNPDLIQPGEKLTLGGTTPTEATDYASKVKEGLTGTPSTSEPDYLTGLQTKIGKATKALETSTSGLKGMKENAYNTEYSASELPKIKTELSDLDTQIAQKKAERDQAVQGFKGNAGLSAAQMTGMAAKISDKANAEINNLIEQRNAKAGAYNTGLTELTTKVGAKTGDAETAYNAAKDLLSSLTGQAKDYQTNLLNMLKNEQTKNYQDQSLAIAMENAKKKGTSGGMTLARDSSGMPLYWYSSSGDIIPLAPGEADSIGAGGGGYGGINAPTDTGAAGEGNAAGAGTQPAGGGWWNAIKSFFTGSNQ